MNLLTTNEIKAQLAELKEREQLLLQLLKKTREVEVIENTFAQCDQTPLDLKKLIRLAAEWFGLSPAKLASRDRHEAVAHARFAVWRIARELFDYPDRILAEIFNRGVPSTVVYGVQAADDLYQTNKTFRERVDSIRNAFLAAQVNGNGVASTIKM